MTDEEKWAYESAKEAAIKYYVYDPATKNCPRGVSGDPALSGDRIVRAAADSAYYDYVLNGDGGIADRPCETNLHFPEWVKEEDKRLGRG